MQKNSLLVAGVWFSDSTWMLDFSMYVSGLVHVNMLLPISLHRSHYAIWELHRHLKPFFSSIDQHFWLLLEVRQLYAPNVHLSSDVTDSQLGRWPLNIQPTNIHQCNNSHINYKILYCSHLVQQWHMRMVVAQLETSSKCTLEYEDLRTSSISNSFI